MTGVRWGDGAVVVIPEAVAWFVRVPPRLVPAIVALGFGALISTVAFDLVAEAHEQGGVVATAGFAPGR